jgi:hypothetical protein
MSDLRRRWLLLKAAFGPSSTTLTRRWAKKVAQIAATDLGEHSPAGVFKVPPPETWLVDRSNPLVNTPIANGAGLRAGHAWARSIIATDLPPDRGLIR